MEDGQKGRYISTRKLIFCLNFANIVFKMSTKVVENVWRSSRLFLVFFLKGAILDFWQPFWLHRLLPNVT